ncbi:MAG: lipopolysaccharide transport periplasmic protein LptA [Pseudomonadota bacterium]|jgi:lipopolysaccharide export system protein LptA
MRLLSKIHALIPHGWWVVACLGVAVIPWGSVARAEKADRDRPMNIEADRLNHDDLKKVSVFQGRVIASKGTILFKGQTLEVREDADGYQQGLLLPAPGQRAFYRQKREGVNEFMEAEAERIEYDGRRDRVILTGNAELRRLRGNALADEIQGQVIVYDNITDQFTVDGAPRNATARAESSTRVRAVLAPKPKDTTSR